MPQTRIRANQPATVKAAAGGTGTGTNPAGSSLTTDDIGMIEVMLAEAAASTPTDTSVFDLAASNADSVTTPTDAASYEITNTNTDTPATPTGAHTTLLTIGATTATATNTAGSGWTNPTNAQGLADGTFATANSAANLTPANQAGTLLLSYATLGTAATETVAANPVLTVTASLTVGLLGSGSLTISYSTDGGTNYTQITSVTATTAGPFTATLTGFTLANIANLRVRAVTSVTGSATAASTANFDAASIVFTTTGSAG